MSVTWNGTTVTGPVLIYTDEIILDSRKTTEIGNPNRPGALICRSQERNRVSWHFTDGTFVNTAPTSNTTFKQIRAVRGRLTPRISRLSLKILRADPGFNGIWHCRLNATGIRDNHPINPATFESQINVGIYSRGEALLDQYSFA